MTFSSPGLWRHRKNIGGRVLTFTPVPSEAELLLQVRWFLNLLKRAGLLTWAKIHIAGKMRGGRIIGRNRDMIGFFDIEVVARGRVGYIELKRLNGGKPRPEQLAFREDRERHGAPCAFCNRLESVVEFLETRMDVRAREFLKFGGQRA